VRLLVDSHRRSRRWPPTSRRLAEPQTPPLDGTLLAGAVTRKVVVSGAIGVLLAWLPQTVAREVASRLRPETDPLRNSLTTTQHIRAQRARQSPSTTTLTCDNTLVGLTGFEPATPCASTTPATDRRSYAETCADLRQHLVAATGLLRDLDLKCARLPEYSGNKCGTPEAPCGASKPDPNPATSPAHRSPRGHDRQRHTAQKGTPVDESPTLPLVAQRGAVISAPVATLALAPSAVCHWLCGLRQMVMASAVREAM
jgi:hypothetical protein